MASLERYLRMGTEDSSDKPAVEPEPSLAELVRQARSTLPELALEDEAFLRYLEQHEQGRRLLSDPSARGGEAVAELWLACGLALDMPAAQYAFESRYLTQLAPRLGLALDAAQLDEIRQRTREKLLLKDGAGRRRVEGYAGQGRLSGLVRVVATREAVELFRKTRREVSFDWSTLAEEPEAPMKEGYRRAFQECFIEALCSLGARERTLLRLHWLGGVTLEALATMYGVHRATIVRWLAAARAEVHAQTRRLLAARLEARPEEVESLLGWVTSRLDMSLGAALETLQRSHHSSDA